MQALKKIAALRQKELELVRAHGKQAEKVQTMFLVASDEPWLVECFINGICGWSRLRRVFSQFHKTQENDINSRSGGRITYWMTLYLSRSTPLRLKYDLLMLI